MNKYSFLLVLLLTSLSVPASHRSELVVVAHPDARVSQLTRSELINIFMGRYRKLPSGLAAMPVDLGPLREKFYRELVNKDMAEINSYWARLMFSGQASPPVHIETESELLEYVRRNPGAIGFVDSARVPDDLVVVMTFAEH
jgi:ABC-type phosphate transport system substrate-binding protein